MTRIAIFHPDLGLGGAERLIVDTAVQLQNKGHIVTIFTSYHSKLHCFEETRDGTINVQVHGSWIPRTFFGLFYILFATLKSIWLTFCFYFTHSHENYEIFLVDQMANCLPFIRFLFPSSPILFYCHYPDKLLSKPGGILKQIYRMPMDYLEEWSLSHADTILVNSKYTSNVFKQHFSKLFQHPISSKTPHILYPGIIPDGYNMSDTLCKKTIESCFSKEISPKKMILSLNRFERKKDIHLAIEGYHYYCKFSSHFVPCILIIAGGYDPRVKENVEYHRDLQLIAEKCNLRHETIWPGSNNRIEPQDIDVLFLPSISSTLRNALLHTADFVLYTPSNEHFGLVPIEAMICGAIVIAMNSGGPTESIVHEKNGFLVDSDAKSIGKLLEHLLKLQRTDSARIQTIILNAKKRVNEMFTMEQFTNELVSKMTNLLKNKK